MRRSTHNRSSNVNNTAENIAWKLLDIERGYTSTPIVSAVFAAYALAIATENPEAIGLDDVLKASKASPFIHRAIHERLDDHWDRYRPLLTAFAREDLAECITKLADGDHLLNGKTCPSASSSPIVDLAVRLLDVKEGESVCDFGCAGGDFLLRVASTAGSAKNHLLGIEVSSDIAAIAEIRKLQAGLDIEICNGSFFDKAFREHKHDKVFCDPPLADRGVALNPDARATILSAFPDFPEITPSSSGVWLYAARAVAGMKKNGRTVVLVPSSSLFDLRNAAYRRYFVQRNLIRAVIELPERLFPHTGIATYLLVFGEGGEETVMVRAKDLCYPNRKSNVIGKGHVDIIAACLGLEATRDPQGLDKYRKVIAKPLLLENDCNLTARRFFTEPVRVKDGVALGSLVRSVKRGAPLSSGDLDKLVGDEDTPFSYVTPGNISEGGILSGATFLKDVPARYRSCCAEDGDLIVSRIFSKDAEVKTAVVSNTSGKTILPNGNLLVLSVDREKADPYYIKACLDSAYAKRYFEDRAAGSMILTVGAGDLESLPIPALPLQRQREIGEILRSKTTRVEELRAQLATATRDLSTVLQNNAGDCFARPEKED